jgi:hypothetical protein
MAPQVTIVGDRNTCNVTGLTAFAPGFHKQQLFTPDDTKRMVAAFAKLRGKINPQAKLGHDTSQRLKLSLGFPSLGDVVAVRADAQGRPVLDLANVPVEIGQAINGGQLRSVSIEVVPKAPNPDDPAEEIAGPILTAVSFLGEEQPAVKGLPPIPKATFPDGTLVPPATSAAPWLSAMAEVLKHSAGAFSEAYRPTVTIGGREIEAAVLSFNDWTPPEIPAVDDKQQQLAALGLSPEQVAQIIQICGSGAMADGPGAATVPPAVPGQAAVPGQMADAATMPTDPNMMAACAKKFAADPAATDEQKMFAAMFSQFSDLTKRFGAMEAATSASQKKDEDAKMAAFSERVDRDILAKLADRIEPVVIAAVHKPALLNILTAAKFSSESDREQTYTKYFSDLMGAWPVSTKLAQPAATAKTSDGMPIYTPAAPGFTNKLVGRGSVIDRHAGEAAKKLRARIASGQW